MTSATASFSEIPPATSVRRFAIPPAWPGVLLAFAATCMTVGIMWDISWHETIGRDTFWTPAHMAIYLGGALGGMVGGWMAIKYTFFSSSEEREQSVNVLGAHAPLGAWLAIWGGAAMLTSGPFDNWWHDAYGLDVKIISPPHALLGMGMFGIVFGALITVLSRQNRLADGSGSGLFVYVGGVFLMMAGVFVMEYVFPNLQHTAIFYEVCAAAFPIRLVTMAVAGRTSWPATRMALVYMLGVCVMVWVLPLFPAQPKLAPIYNPVTRMVPPPFPLLLIFPAILFDWIIARTGERFGWRRVGQALVLGLAFVAVFLVVQWFFSEFLMSRWAENWFFVGNKVWSYIDTLGDWTHRFWQINPKEPGASVLTITAVLLAWLIASGFSWLGLLLGGWMRKVQR